MSKSKAVHYTIPTSLDQDERIKDYLIQLRLLGIIPYYKELAEDNIKNHNTPKAFLELCLQKQLIDSKQRQTSSRLLKAGFGQEKTLEEFDFNAKTNVCERQIRELTSCNFIKEKKNIVFMGESHTGKTHLAKAIARKAIDQEYNVRFITIDRLIDELLFKKREIDIQQRFFDSLVSPDLLVLDEIKDRKSTSEIQEFLYRLICYRYEHKPTIFTSCKDFSVWEKLFGDFAQETLNRILDRDYLILIEIKGEPYKISKRIINDATAPTNYSSFA